MCKYAFKKLPFSITYVPDWYKTQQMCHKAILGNGETLKSVLYYYKNKKMCNKGVDNYSHALKFVLEGYETHKNVW